MLLPLEAGDVVLADGFVGVATVRIQFASRVMLFRVGETLAAEARRLPDRQDDRRCRQDILSRPEQRHEAFFRHVRTTRASQYAMDEQHRSVSRPKMLYLVRRSGLREYENRDVR